MRVEMRIEQTPGMAKRVRYVPNTDSFVETEYDYLGYLRGFTGYYGWITATGTPPGRHLDVTLLSDRDYGLGDYVDCRVIGYFHRNDLDHKILAVDLDSDVATLEDLSVEERRMLERIYPVQTGPEGWYPVAPAVAIVQRSLDEQEMSRG